MTISLSSLEISPLTNPSAPPSQKAGDRPISFFLVDGTQPASSPASSGFSLSGLANLVKSGGSATPSSAGTQSIDLNIRPEELTRTDPSRAIVQQTLGGAWVDDFGEGVAQINIKGHTGWRGSATADGMTLFANLKKMVYTDYHGKRRKARMSGLDPSLVTLTFSDALDSIVENVFPMTFILQRSKSRPLLMQYQIAMLSLGPATKPKTQGFLAGLLNAMGLTSLANAVNTISDAIGTIKDFVNNVILGPIKAFMNLAVSAFNAVVGMVNSATGFISSVIDTAESIAQAGAQIFHTIQAVRSLPNAVSAQLNSVASAFTNVFCLLANTTSASVYPNYAPLLGASNCSSTAGGEPPSQYTMTNTNPFYDVVGQPATPPIVISQSAAAALQQVVLADPVLSPMTQQQLIASLNVVNSGLTVNS